MKRAKRRQHPRKRAWVYRQFVLAPAWAMDADYYNGTPPPLVCASQCVTVYAPYEAWYPRRGWRKNKEAGHE